MISPTRQHPNASLAAAAAAFSTGLIGLLTGTGLVSLTATDGSIVTGGVVSGSLLIGRAGLRGICMWLWRGDQEPA